MRNQRPKTVVIMGGGHSIIARVGDTIHVQLGIPRGVGTFHTCADVSHGAEFADAIESLGSQHASDVARVVRSFSGGDE